MNKVKFYNQVLYDLFINALNSKGIKWETKHRYNWLKFKGYLEIEILDN